MKRALKIIGVVLVMLLVIVFSIVTSHAADNVEGQISCGTTAEKIWGGGEYIGATFLTLSPSTAIYIGTASTLTTATAPIVLSSTSVLGFSADKGDDSWYCRTASGTSTLGFIIRKR